MDRGNTQPTDWAWEDSTPPPPTPPQAKKPRSNGRKALLSAGLGLLLLVPVIGLQSLFDSGSSTASSSQYTADPESSLDPREGASVFGADTQPLQTALAQSCGTTPGDLTYRGERDLVTPSGDFFAHVLLYRIASTRSWAYYELQTTRWACFRAFFFNPSNSGYYPLGQGPGKVAPHGVSRDNAPLKV